MARGRGLPAGSSESLVRVAVRVPAAEAEEARALALELVPGGFEERSEGSVVELGLYVERADVERLRAVFPAARVAAVEPGWEDAWRAFHRPVVAGGVWIGPPWEAPAAGLPAVVIDPGRAFGTGAHPTTRLCVELLAGVERGSLLDVGCGSGVVVLAASRLGFAPLVAVDVDSTAVEVARSNVAANGVETDVRLLDATLDELPPADVAVANIALDTVERVLARLVARTAVTSGYLVHELPQAVGWRRADRLELDGWAADLFARGE